MPLEQSRLFELSSKSGSWPARIASSPAIDEAGLFIGADTRLARLSRSGGLALAVDGERLLALLSVAAGRPVPAEILEPIAAAAGYWQRGDKALANLRLVFAGLPRLESDAAVENLRDAADLLDGGLPPRALMKALGFDTASLDRFDPSQPRVPAGSGPTSGRWTNGAGGAMAIAPAASPRQTKPGLPIVPVADDGPLVPGGEMVIPHDGIVDPLDPANLNTPLSPAEQQTIADTVNMIRAGRPQDLAILNPHSYENRPHKIKGAQLPLNEMYTTHYVRALGAAPGNARIVKGSGGSFFYSNNHYKSFYPIDQR